MLEVSGQDVVLTELGQASLGAFAAHDQAQQGRLPCPVGAHEGDAIAPLDLQVGVEKEDLVAVAVAEVADLCHQAA